MPDLQLPERDADLYRWAQRAGALFDRGVDPAFQAGASRQRFAGPDEAAGLSPTGHLRNFRIFHTMVRNKATYRHQETGPERRAIILIDLRYVANDADSARLISCAIAAATMIAGVPGTQLRWAGFGAAGLVGTTLIEGDRPAGMLRGAGRHLLRLQPDRYASSTVKQTGVIRRLTADDPDAHMVLVSHHLERGLVASIPRPAGATAFLVEPGEGVLGHSRGAAGLAAALPAGYSGEENVHFRDMADDIRTTRIRRILVDAGEPLLASLTRGLARS